MWVIWFGPLVVVAFLAGLTAAAVLLRLGKLRTPRSALAAVALPFGCAALPVLGLSVLSIAASAFAPDPQVLYTDLFAPFPPPAADRLLADAFGEGRTREILLRIDASAAERNRLLALPGLARAAMTAEDFSLRGTRRGLDGWWMRPFAPGAATRAVGTDCLSPQIYAADGLNGWREIRLALCAPDRGDAPPVFVAAFGH